MNTADPLSRLRDIHLPEPVSWWPPAPGWWILALLVLIVLFLGFLLLHRFLSKNRYRRLALQELADLKAQKKNDHILLEQVSALLRRVAIQTYGREAVAPLSGPAWLAFLDKTGQTDAFSGGPAKILGDGMYRAAIDADMDKICTIAEKWIRRHRP